MKDLRALDSLKLADKSNECHFLLSVPARHGRVGGGQFHLPSLQGMSGGGIWRFEIDDRTRMITIPSLVGLGIEHHKKQRAIVGTEIRVAMPLVPICSHSQKPETVVDPRLTPPPSRTILLNHG
jgi:hypothetical protein